MGILGALIGVLASLGRGRRVVLAGLVALGISGLVLLTVGGVALALGQPHEELELRRMRALDARA